MVIKNRKRRPCVEAINVLSYYNTHSISLSCVQLEQLHFMGILDDALSIQALDAAGGDIQAALEIIYTR